MNNNEKSPLLLNCDPVTHTSIIDKMIDLRRQIHKLEQEIDSLRPDFFAACAALNTERICTGKAIISRRLTPGQWDYPPDIEAQENLLKQLKQQFQQTHEPIRGREIIWVIKLLSNESSKPDERLLT